MEPSNEPNEAVISLFVTSSAFVKWSSKYSFARNQCVYLPNICAGTAPERRNDARYLPLIPSEIYLMIFEELLRSLKPCNPTKYERTMASLSLVCSFFRAVCQSQIFQKLSFTGAGRTRKVQDHHRNWRMSLAAHDARCIALSSHVKSCIYDGWVSESHEHQISMAVLVQNLQSASFLLSLTSVELYSCPIPPSALLALANIPTLIAVNMHRCETRPDRSNTLSDIPERGWTSLRIFRCYDMGEHFASTLMKLIDYAKLKSLVVPDFTTAEFVESLIPPDVTSNGHLETLDVMLPENTSVFLNYLKRARNLQYLFVRDRDTNLEEESEITLSCRVELSNAVAGRLFSCKINLLTCSTEMDISVFRTILGAWNPPLKLTKLKFSMLLNFQDPFNNAEDLDLSRAVLPPMLDLFTRMKVSCHWP